MLIVKIQQLIKESSDFVDIPLYVGSNTVSEGTIQFRFRAKPRNTIPFVHQLVNDLTTEKFGLPIRNLFFCTPDPDHAETYGTLYEVTPVGKWRAFAAQDVTDMTLDIGAMNYHIESDIVKQFMGDDRPIVKTKIQPLLRNINRESNIDDFINKLRSVIPHDLASDVDASLHRVRDSIMRKLTEYVASIEELTMVNSDDLLSEGAEVMLYSPDGINLRREQ